MSAFDLLKTLQLDSDSLTNLTNGYSPATSEPKASAPVLPAETPAPRPAGREADLLAILSGTSSSLRTPLSSSPAVKQEETDAPIDVRPTIERTTTPPPPEPSMKTTPFAFRSPFDAMLPGRALSSPATKSESPVPARMMTPERSPASRKQRATSAQPSASAASSPSKSEAFGPLPAVPIRTATLKDMSKVETTPISLFTPAHRSPGKRLAAHGFVAYATPLGRIRVVDTDTGARLLLQGLSSPIIDLHISPGSVSGKRLIAAVDHEGTVMVWRIDERLGPDSKVELESRHTSQTAPSGATVRALRFNPDPATRKLSLLASSNQRELSDVFTLSMDQAKSGQLDLISPSNVPGATIPHIREQHFDDAQWSLDGKSLVLLGSNGSGSLYDVEQTPVYPSELLDIGALPHDLLSVGLLADQLAPGGFSLVAGTESSISILPLASKAGSDCQTKRRKRAVSRFDMTERIVGLAQTLKRDAAFTITSTGTISYIASAEADSYCITNIETSIADAWDIVVDMHEDSSVWTTYVLHSKGINKIKIPREALREAETITHKASVTASVEQKATAAPVASKAIKVDEPALSGPPPAPAVASTPAKAPSPVPQAVVSVPLPDRPPTKKARSTALPAEKLPEKDIKPDLVTPAVALPSETAAKSKQATPAKTKGKDKAQTGSEGETAQPKPAPAVGASKGGDTVPVATPNRSVAPKVSSKAAQPIAETAKALRAADLAELEARLSKRMTDEATAQRKELQAYMLSREEGEKERQIEILELVSQSLAKLDLAEAVQQATQTMVDLVVSQTSERLQTHLSALLEDSNSKNAEQRAAFDETVKSATQATITKSLPATLAVLQEALVLQMDQQLAKLDAIVSKTQQTSAVEVEKHMIETTSAYKAIQAQIGDLAAAQSRASISVASKSPAIIANGSGLGLQPDQSIEGVPSFYEDQVLSVLSSQDADQLAQFVEHSDLPLALAVIKARELSSPVVLTLLHRLGKADAATLDGPDQKKLAWIISALRVIDPQDERTRTYTPQVVNALLKESLGPRLAKYASPVGRSMLTSAIERAQLLLPGIIRRQ
ncbi:uncharacterized protein L969DRAFT_22298 [Mixia osmundae IAM 14324]|uniref:Enhancer of mRNA-decapping protein 4 WD40 repeat region domain-containing protein n=1 Tax=Mixia osmundae (strain CBS 9802 / IAM 14324 / JCM 22182 / KY 12970) TaxID=764103 RepID=G7DYU9_MIXOS|nr:uncharacterized protein L969DRAFT_22298 [Mixia osmundae IAM 14324]KEI41655.1 hypothetical protein L969DRAFT_22298 [Mixia osmundae IAM 14324]GAA95759.1 hypothetical protein E5Q_02416 [Mixia osmundae IAM 14324]